MAFKNQQGWQHQYSTSIVSEKEKLLECHKKWRHTIQMTNDRPVYNYHNDAILE